jgi:hypothetical protein
MKNVKKHLKEIGYECVHWVHAAQDRDHQQALVNTVMNFEFCKRQVLSLTG